MNKRKSVQTNQAETTAKSGNKIPLIMIIGASVGVIVTFLRKPEQRERLKEGSKSKKEAINNYVSDVRENPSARMQDLVARLRKTFSIINGVIATVQNVMNKQGKEIMDRAEDIKEESEEIISTAKDAGEDLQEAGEKAMEAKEELTSSEEDSADKAVHENASRY